jgi:hypothetical protein
MGRSDCNRFKLVYIVVAERDETHHAIGRSVLPEAPTTGFVTIRRRRARRWITSPDPAYAREEHV